MTGETGSRHAGARQMEGSRKAGRSNRGSSLAVRILNRLRPWLAGSRVPLFAALASVVLSVPSLWNGLDIDDWVHRIILTRAPGLAWMVPTPANPFTFFNGDRERTRALVDIGIAPWWTNFDLRIQFWRPLATWTHRLDYLLWPTHPAGMHFQSLVWLGMLVVAVAMLYRRIWEIDGSGRTAAGRAGLSEGASVQGAGLSGSPGAWGAGLATVMYAIDDAHGFPVGWVANRNALMATFFGVLALWAYDRWRRDRWRAGAGLAPIFFGLSLLSAELGVATSGYLLAYALFLDRGRWLQRLARLLPCVAVGAAWSWAYRALGFGAWGSGYYLDPVHEPVRFAGAVLERGPLLWQGMLGLPPSDVYILLPKWGAAAQYVGGLAFLGVTVAVFSPMVRRSATARFWALGAGLSLLPVCATFPMDRLLLFVGLGGLALVARYLEALVEPAEALADPAETLPDPAEMSVARTMGGRAAQALALFWISIHLVLAPLLLPLRVANPGRWEHVIEQLTDSVNEGDSLAGQDLVVLNAPDGTFSGFVKLIKMLRGLPAPAHVWTLAVGTQALEVSRPDGRTLVVKPEGGFLADRGAPLVRDGRDRMALGEKVVLSGMTAEVTAMTGDGRPAEATFRFVKPLEDPSLRWVCWRLKELVSFSPPAVGQTVTVPAVELGLGR